MAKRGFPGFGGGNMNNLMKQAQKMQRDMEKLQDELQEKEVEATAGGGAVKVIATGKKEIKEITIDPDVVDPDDVEMLQDLVLAAVNEALRKAEEMVSTEMSKLTGGLGLGGLFCHESPLFATHRQTYRRIRKTSGDRSQDSSKTCLPHIESACREIGKPGQCDKGSKAEDTLLFHMQQHNGKRSLQHMRQCEA